MKNKRLINNLTNMSLKATLYVQAANDLKAIYGTLNVDLNSGESTEVEYGDLRNGYLLGLRINPIPFDPIDTYYAVVRHRGDAVDAWLNNSVSIDITVEHLHAMEGYSSIELITRGFEEVFR